MIITIAFDVKNYVEVMEGWPIKLDDTTFSLEREGNVLKRVCISFSGVDIKHAPTLTLQNEIGNSAHISIHDSGYADMARKRLMNWQTVVSGIQIIDLNYDDLEIRFHAESFEEESHIQLHSIKSSFDKALNSTCDFEQLGRAFCAELVSDDRIESTSHYREGRLAFEAGRYVDAYNNTFLFLETRYCDGKTKTVQQIELLSNVHHLCRSIEENAKSLSKTHQADKAERLDLFSLSDTTIEKIKALVLLRGKLRHHSLKSPHRWDPNKQNMHKAEARFLLCVVSDIVIKESLEDIYAPAPLEIFRSLSVNSGNETKIRLKTRRVSNEKALELEMSYPTTVVSSLLCSAAFRHGIKACETGGQLADTVNFEATHMGRDIELFCVDFGVWAYTSTREIRTENPIEFIRCSFEHIRSDLVVKNEFSIPYKGQSLTIADIWNFLKFSFGHIEDKEPTTRIMNLKLFVNNGTNIIAAYRVGPLART